MRTRFRGQGSGVRRQESGARGQGSGVKVQAPQFPVRGSVLVAVLWCLALLFLIVVGVLHTARIDLLVTKHYEDKLRAHYLALAGVEKAKAIIYQDARARSRNRKSHTLDLYDAPSQFRKVQFGGGDFTVFHRGSIAEGGRILYGVNDEESRLDVNYAGAEELSKLYRITPDVIAAIIDWRDKDNTVTPGGAEIEYYASLMPPRRPRNGPFETVRELLMVRGVSPELLLGQDTRQNGLIDSLEEPDSGITSSEELGWASYLTVNASVDNVNVAGTDRVNIQTADEAALSQLPGVSPDLAKAIVRYRGQKRFESIVDLLDVTAPQDQGDAEASRVITQTGRPGGPAPQPGANPSGAPAPGGPKLISQALFMEIADDITTQNEETLAGVVNVNSACLETLVCLPGVTREIAQAIISFRESNGFLPNIGHLLKVPGINQDILRQLAPRITARSETYRILCEGRVASSGARQRIEETVHLSLNTMRTLAYRENDL